MRYEGAAGSVSKVLGKQQPSGGKTPGTGPGGIPNWMSGTTTPGPGPGAMPTTQGAGYNANPARWGQLPPATVKQLGPTLPTYKQPGRYGNGQAPVGGIIGSNPNAWMN